MKYTFELKHQETRELFIVAKIEEHQQVQVANPPESNAWRAASSEINRLAQLLVPVDLAYAKEVCKIGQGADCCRFLTMGPNGFSCEKHGQHSGLLTLRAIAGRMVARSDNCQGRASQ